MKMIKLIRALFTPFIAIVDGEEVSTSGLEMLS